MSLPAFYVRASRCDECLFSKNRIVSRERMKEVLADCKKKDTHFVCHKVKIGMCRGFYDTQPVPQTLRLAQAFERMGLGQVVFTNEGTKR